MIQRQWQSNLPILPKTPFLMCIVGSRGSGKTSLLLHMLTQIPLLRYQFSRIILISPTVRMDPIWVSTIKFRRFEVYEQYSDLIVEHLINDQKQMQHDHGMKEDILFILDDISCEKTKNSPGLNCIANNGRHMNISVIMASQRIYHFSTDIRSNCDAIIQFPIGNGRELSVLFAEFGVCSTKQEFKAILEYCTESYDVRNFFMILLFQGSVFYFRNFNENVTIQ